MANPSTHSITIEHVRVGDLPEPWRVQLQVANNVRVTVRIEEENSDDDKPFVTDDPAFGIWRDRTDMADVGAYLRKLRAPRFDLDGMRKKD